MQAFDAFFSYFDIGWMTPIAAVMLISASLAGMLTWLAGPSKGLLEISRSEGYLPPFLQQFNRFGIHFTSDDRFVTGNPFTTYAIPIDPIAVAVLLAERFNALGIVHTIGGSIASAFAGEPRSTADIDVVAAIEETQIPAITTA